MSIASLTEKDRQALQDHGHTEFWEIASFGPWTKPYSVTLECTQCGIVLLELVHEDEED
jgi:hypothetical protein